jgi:hypothetical protein
VEVRIGRDGPADFTSGARVLLGGAIEMPLLLHGTQPKQEEKNPKKRKKNTLLAFLEGLLDLQPCSLQHAGQMIS